VAGPLYKTATTMMSRFLVCFFVSCLLYPHFFNLDNEDDEIKDSLIAMFYCSIHIKRMNLRIGYQPMPC
jgi:hypothetical protein